jgi:putative phosphoesterase
MKLCILSDSHDNRTLLAAAVNEAKRLGAEAVLHCGDVVAPGTLSVLQPHGLPVHVIYGNNMGDIATLARIAAKPNSVIRFHGQDATLTLGGRRIFLVHYQHYGRAMALTGDYDLVCCGHEHRVAIEEVNTITGGNCWLVNPGTVGGIGMAAGYIMGDLDTMHFEWRAVT